jgi:hypothetical protein
MARLVLAVLLAAATLTACGDDQVATARVVAPTMVGGAPLPEPGPDIPRGFLTYEPLAAQPAEDPDVHWELSDDPRLPPLVFACGGAPPSDAHRVAGRQVALVHPGVLWKLERLVIYRDEEAAVAAMGERRDALRECRAHDGTEWRSRSLAIGDEGLFVTSRRPGGTGSHRAVLARQGRAVVMYVDFGLRPGFSALDEVAGHRHDAETTVRRLRAAPWAG